MLSVYVFFTFLDTSSKYLVLAGVSALIVAWTRFAVHVLLVGIFLRGWREPVRFRPVNLQAQVARGLFLFGSTIFNVLALQTLQLAETTSIYFFGPMIITALAGPLLGEWAGWRRWLAILTGFVGVLIITRPGVGAFGIGHVFAICSILSNCLYVIMTRRLAATETAESLILFSALGPAVVLLPLLPFSFSLPHDGWHWFILLMLGVFGGIGHWLLVQAYRLATTTALAPYPYSQMIWMIISGWLVFSQFPDRWTLIGAAVIVASGLYIVHREHRLRLRNHAALDAEAETLAKKL
ncbi:DMT family transporter [Mesorhizobium sp. YC-39]|uniref:DMT family transporter n=1 Tax=unclassified Mesorhizobium TaxID=325217 RepID=UPI0021E8E4E2|nr:MULTISPECIES: DMT family transporter [unclassified Mesorhizobium]MCV3206190.1 DMT family transporter [Mesorhizobium sp. YC-2]MCV3227410.1 DMT family transporter [Mesorhizobium sp. YC-39]